MQQTTFPTEIRDGENGIIDSLFLSKLLLKLDPEDRRVMEEHLAGMTSEEIGIPSEYTVRKIIHKMARLANIEWKCEKCGQLLPVERFNWNSPTRCSACESNGTRYRRNCIERWESALLANDVWRCRSCGEEKPVREFSVGNRTECRACKNWKCSKAAQRIKHA
jgi:hypothetical protein